MRALLLAFTLLSVGCFDVDEPLCTFACGDNGLCPDNYMCLPDGYCHLHGTAGSCGYPDAAMFLPDLSGSADMSSDDGPPAAADASDVD